ncbi:MAG: sigma-70 region 4 domain-containing protein [Chloroflexi bacterium]|nr:sigma-70 region 4 domain-containing protein [Chloroflexota bacterium]
MPPKNPCRGRSDRNPRGHRTYGDGTPTRQRVVCLLADVFDLSMTEIARILRVTPGAAKAMLSRARVALKGREALSAGPANLARIDPAPNDALVLSLPRCLQPA